MWIRYLNSSRIRYGAWRQGQALILPRQSAAEAQNAARAGDIVVEIAIGLLLASKPSVLSARCAPARRVSRLTEVDLRPDPRSRPEPKKGSYRRTAAPAHLLQKQFVATSH